MRSVVNLMTHSESLKDLDELRTSVQDHLKKARKGVKSFHRESDNAFWRDSEQSDEDKANTIITARSYLALFYSDIALTDAGEPRPRKWMSWFRKYVSACPFKEDKDGCILPRRKKSKKDRLNNFELAHLPDLILCKNIYNRFWNKNSAVHDEIIAGVSDETRKICDKLEKLLGEHDFGPRNPNTDQKENRPPDDRSDTKCSSLQTKGMRGEVPLSDDEPESNHYFVTLHLLRGVATLCPHSNSDRWSIPAGIRGFCIEQAFYAQRGIRHRQDAFRLAFAGTIYCLYDSRAERDVVRAIVESLENCQQSNGMWPASHPIFRKEKGKEPWHISSHEIALCLTWLYFQPNMPDDSRMMLLNMMERYFRNWVVSTYRRSESGEYRGWYDDHSIGEDLVVGWATAIVCHFLAGYYWVLCDWINRRVIEYLGIERHSTAYLIAESAPLNRKQPKWQRENNRTIWPDLPPYRWQASEADNLAEKAAERLRSKWNDPGTSDSSDSEEELISDRIAKEILLPTYVNPGSRPDRFRCSILLPGKPGTGKSTFVKQVAQTLQWPLISVPGSIIFDKGFDYLEARANEVFALLNMLTSCVIFFDEFEEFLRRRPEADGSADSHTRTIAAFTTSSMLTRMQELHDEARCLIFLATNHREQIDPAACRPGRIDYDLEIAHPKVTRLKKFLEHPPARLLRDLNIKNGKGSQEWHALKSEVLEALGGSEVKKRITKGTAYRDSETVPFRYIQAALKAAQRNSGENMENRNPRQVLIRFLDAETPDAEERES